MKKYLFLFLTFSIVLNAQQDAYLSLIDYQMPLVNPAYAGSEGQQFSLNVRNQWANVDNSPRTLSLVYSLARGKNVGLGISVIADEIFIEKQTFVSVDFSYKLKLNEKSTIFLGLKGAANSFTANTSNLIAYDQSEDPSKRDMSRLNPNVGVGILFKKNQVWLSASLPRLFNVKRNEEIYLNAKDRVHFYMSGGLWIDTSESFKIGPRFIYRNARGIQSISDFSLWGSYRQKFDFGIGYRTQNVMIYKFNIRIKESFSISYSYDAYFGNNTVINQLSAHEFGVKINLNNNSEKMVEEEDLLNQSLSDGQK